MRKTHLLAVTAVLLGAGALCGGWYLLHPQGHFATGPTGAGHREVPQKSAVLHGASVGAAESRLEAPSPGNDSRNGWRLKYFEAKDIKSFIKQAATPALHGDGRAAYYIGEALATCAAVAKMYQGSSDPEAQLQMELAAQQRAPQWARDLYAEQVHRCLSMASGDVFAELPARKGGYPRVFWYEEALADGDPLAQVRNAATALSIATQTSDVPADVKDEKLRIAKVNIEEVIQSGDADAIFHTGLLLANGSYSRDPTTALAVALAACDLGHDCSADNPDNALFFNCKRSGGCPAGADFAYYLQQSLGGSQYAKVDALAQEVKRSFATGDLSAVEAALNIAM